MDRHLPRSFVRAVQYTRNIVFTFTKKSNVIQLDMSTYFRTEREKTTRKKRKKKTALRAKKGLVNVKVVCESD